MRRRGGDHESGLQGLDEKVPTWPCCLVHRGRRSIADRGQGAAARRLGAGGSGARRRRELRRAVAHHVVHTTDRRPGSRATRPIFLRGLWLPRPAAVARCTRAPGWPYGVRIRTFSLMTTRPASRFAARQRRRGLRYSPGHPHRCRPRRRPALRRPVSRSLRRERGVDTRSPRAGRFEFRRGRLGSLRGPRRPLHEPRLSVGSRGFGEHGRGHGWQPVPVAIDGAEAGGTRSCRPISRAQPR